MTAPAVEIDPLDTLDSADHVALTTPDPIAGAVLADPFVRQHVDRAKAAGVTAARQALAQLRLTAIPEAEAAAAPYVDLMAKLDEERKSGALNARLGGQDLADRFYERERDALRRDLSTAVSDAVAKVRERLDNIEASVQAASTDAPPSALTVDQSRAMADLLTLLPHLSDGEKAAQMENAVAAAAGDQSRRDSLRHLLPVLRSMAERPEFARSTDNGLRLHVAIRRAEALTRDWRHEAANAMARYAGLFRYELGVIEAAIAERGRWGGSRAASRRTVDGRAMLRVAIAPAWEEPVTIPTHVPDVGASRAVDWRRHLKSS